jgi:hypothetical protein
MLQNPLFGLFGYSRYSPDNLPSQIKESGWFSMLRTNIRNLVRQTQLPKWKPLLPMFEAVMNSFQAIRDANRKQGQGRIRIVIERENSLLPDEAASVQTSRQVRKVPPVDVIPMHLLRWHSHPALRAVPKTDMLSSRTSPRACPIAAPQLDVATYSSGLPRLPDGIPNDVNNPYAAYTVEELYAFLGNHTLRFDPGTHYEYAESGIRSARARPRAAGQHQLRGTRRVARPRRWGLGIPASR